MGNKYRKDVFTWVAYIGGTGLVATGGVAYAQGMMRDAIYLLAYGTMIDALGFFHDQWRYKQHDCSKDEKKKKEGRLDGKDITKKL
jgi:hypothetical protein